MLRVGIVGIGFMGMMHYLAWQKVRGARVAAICTRDAKKLAGDWRDIRGNFGPPGSLMELGDVARYADWEALVADPRIDLVDICLPPALHAEVAIAAVKAGKHVLVEKPIALEPAAGRKMVQAAERAGKQLMIAHVLPFFPEYAYARKLIASGKYGKLLGGYFKRIVAEPSWMKDFFDPRTVGGPVVDLHIHDAHFIRLVCGMPRAVFSVGRMRGEVAELFTTQFLYADNLAVTAASGVIPQQGRSFTHAFEIYLERATLLFDSAVIGGESVVSVPLTVLASQGKVLRPQLGAADAFVVEMAEAARAVRSGQPSPLLAGQLALDALVLCQKQTQSVRSGKPVAI
ncbi:MAG TPA: Gfo/Idh/MocA family oxidoreductase [Pirellulales bacterium]|nr:Gfo/Idh/MocA family oxidoreductase [Pirellulales bacterium]